MVNHDTVKPCPLRGIVDTMLTLYDYRARQRDYLLEISRALTAQLNLDEVLSLVLSASVSMLTSEVGMIALREDNQQFHTRATFGIDPDKYAVFDPLLEDLIDESGSGLNLATINIKTKLIARKLDRRLRQVVALPMLMAHELLGVIFVFRTYIGESSANDQMILQSFADQAAIAVNNARLYQHISEERQRLAAILDHSADGIMILDGEQQITRFNQALARITGWKPSAALGQRHDAVLLWERIDQGQPLGAAIRAGWRGDPLYLEGDIRRPDGSQLSIGVTYAGTLDAQGGLGNVIANIRDITNFRKAQETKSTFISVISHELKTPVALIKGYASTLRREDANWDRATIRNGLSIIEEETDRLSELIENLLAASKLQAEGMRLTLAEGISLPQIAARSVERMQTQTSKHQLQLVFPKNFPTIRGDETRLRQMFDNLISNAIKYSPDGGNVLIKGRATKPDQQVIITISDQGVGIAQDEIPRLFERFYRVDNALSRQTQGTGLGLYLTQAIVKAHGGSIGIESALGKGTTFTLTFPAE
jgi:PAS domain S-box-containing protein